MYILRMLGAEILYVHAEDSGSRGTCEHVKDTGYRYPVTHTENSGNTTSIVELGKTVSYSNHRGREGRTEHSLYAQ